MRTATFSCEAVEAWGAPGPRWMTRPLAPPGPPPTSTAAGMLVYNSISPGSAWDHLPARLAALEWVGEAPQFLSGGGGIQPSRSVTMSAAQAHATRWCCWVLGRDTEAMLLRWFNGEWRHWQARSPPGESRPHAFCAYAPRAQQISCFISSVIYH
ncbi:hypothetical protein AB1Y20_021391 [Prymnesium parvum]|uniref:Uncharacterized protein n=1 Tax=Prymnesium parvum TaxID=97485 RepID=A0AB34JIJ1_PRYPA